MKPQSKYSSVGVAHRPSAEIGTSDVSADPAAVSPKREIMLMPVETGSVTRPETPVTSNYPRSTASHSSCCASRVTMPTVVTTYMASSLTVSDAQSGRIQDVILHAIEPDQVAGAFTSRVSLAMRHCSDDVWLRRYSTRM